MEDASKQVLSQVAEYGLSLTILLAIDLLLIWFIKYLLAELRDSRKESAVVIAAHAKLVENNTAVMTRLEETVRHAMSK